jgi:hypothetical protein
MLAAFWTCSRRRVVDKYELEDLMSGTIEILNPEFVLLSWGLSQKERPMLGYSHSMVIRLTMWDRMYSTLVNVIDRLHNLPDRENRDADCCSHSTPTYRPQQLCRCFQYLRDKRSRWLSKSYRFSFWNVVMLVSLWIPRPDEIVMMYI